MESSYCESSKQVPRNRPSSVEETRSQIRENGQSSDSEDRGMAIDFSVNKMNLEVIMLLYHQILNLDHSNFKTHRVLIHFLKMKMMKVIKITEIKIA